MYSMVCRKDTDVKEVSEKLKKEDDKKPSAWAERTNKRILPIELLVVSPPLIRLAVSQKVRQADTKTKIVFGLVP